MKRHSTTTGKRLIALGLAAGLAAFQQSIELRLRPDLADELVILLDNGRTVTLRAKGTQRFVAGERVGVVSHA